MRSLRNLLMLASVLLLGYCGFVLADGWIYQHRQSERFEKLLHAPVSSTGAPPAGAGGIIGRIEAPRVGISVVVMEGASASILRHAAGHIPGTALPGEHGNVGISAHRDTFFRPLSDIRRNDTITVSTLGGEYRYYVVSTRIVMPNDVSVLDAGSDEVLTLVTCYPFYFIGPAPRRFIVRARRVI
jgi:sortase A